MIKREDFKDIRFSHSDDMHKAFLQSSGELVAEAASLPLLAELLKILGYQNDQLDYECANIDSRVMQKDKARRQVAKNLFRESISNRQAVSFRQFQAERIEAARDAGHKVSEELEAHLMHSATAKEIYWLTLSMHDAFLNPEEADSLTYASCR